MLLALMLAFAPAQVAQASLGDCFDALAPIGTAAEAAKVGATAAACLSAASGDPIMAMTIAAMTAAAVGDMFSTVDECNALINSNLGQVIAAALLSLPLSLSAEQKSLLEQFANGNMPPGLSFTELIATIPGLNLLTVYMQCGCDVAGAPGEFAKIADEYKDSVVGCANFIGDAVVAFLEWMGSGMESLFGGHDFVPGIQMETECNNYEMPANIWTAKRIITRSERRSSCGNTWCRDGFVILEQTAPSGAKQYMCASSCPEFTRTFQPGDLCYGGNEWAQVGERCFPAYRQECCPPGEKVKTWGVCEPACPIDEYFDTKANACSKCPPGQTNAVTECALCPAGQVIWNFDQPGTPKPPGLVATPGPLPPSESAAPRSPAQRVAPGPLPRPSPPPGTVTSGGVPPLPRGPQVMTQSPSGPVLATVPGKCVPCPANWIPVYHADRTKSSLGHCEECLPGTSSSLGQCRPLNCPGGYDPNNPHTCLPTYEAVPVIPGDRPLPTARPGVIIIPVVPDGRTCPQGTRLVAGSCVPVRQAPPQSSQPQQCPPNMVPNPRGPGCIPSSSAVGAQPGVPPSGMRAPAQPTTTTPQTRTQQAPPPTMLQRTPPPAIRQAPPPCPPGLRFVNGQCVR